MVWVVDSMKPSVVSTEVNDSGETAFINAWNSVLSTTRITPKTSVATISGTGFLVNWPRPRTAPHRRCNG